MRGGASEICLRQGIQTHVGADPEEWLFLGNIAQEVGLKCVGEEGGGGELEKIPAREGREAM